MSNDEVGDWGDYMLVSIFGKFAVSVSPNAKDDSDDFVVAMTFGGRRKVAYWRRGKDDTWVVPHCPTVNEQVHDLCFFYSELYATQGEGKVIVFRNLNDHWFPLVVADLFMFTHGYELPANMEGEENNYYPVESQYSEDNIYYIRESQYGEDRSLNDLLFIHRYIVVESYDELKYHTAAFIVFRLYLEKGIVERPYTLRNQAFFVGLNSSFSVVVDDRRGVCKPGCIYYTDDSMELYRFKNGGGGSDMGIYGLRTNTPFYEGPSRFSLINPPTWFEFSSA